jgi:hypothetical protein
VRAPAVALLVAAALAGGALAGCVDKTRAKLGFPSDEVSAKSAVSLARDDAQAWARDATLAGVFTLESPEGMGEGNVSVPPDPKVGNGRAPGWLVSYHSAAKNASLSFIIYPNASKSTVKENEARFNPSAETFDEDAWEIDSTSAMSLLRKNATWQRAEAKGVRSTLMALGPGGEEPGNVTWSVVLFPVNGSPVVGLVDARDGTVRTVSNFTMPGFGGKWGGDWGDWSGNWGDWGSWGGSGRKEYRGSLNAAQPTATHDYEAKSAGKLHLKLSYDAILPTDHVTIRVRGPDGKDASGTQKDKGQGSTEWEGDASEPGGYQIGLSLDSPGATVDYRLTVTIE